MMEDWGLSRGWPGPEGVMYFPLEVHISLVSEVGARGQDLGRHTTEVLTARITIFQHPWHMDTSHLR